MKLVFKLAFISDPHILIDKPRARLDNVLETGLEKMRFVLDWCDKKTAALFIAGDLTDKPRSWHLLPILGALFSKYPNVEKFAVFGQHDTYMYSEETRDATILGSLASAGLIKILREEPFFVGDGNFTRCYGCHYGQKVPKVDRVKSKKEYYKNILVVHSSIALSELWPGHEYMDAASFLRRNKDYDIIHCGDIHREFHVKNGKRIIFNTGPMMRSEATEYNFKHRPNFMVYDTRSNKFQRIEIPHKPAEEVLSREHLESAEEKEEMLTEFISNLDRRRQKGASVLSILKKLIEKNREDLDKRVIAKLSKMIDDSMEGVYKTNEEGR